MGKNNGERYARPNQNKSDGANSTMKYKVEFKSNKRNYIYTVRAENVLAAEEFALKKLKKDIPSDYFTAGQYQVEHIENIPDVRE
jgi:hypothetical protein